MIRRPPRSTLDRSSAASDVYKRQVFACIGGAVQLVFTYNFFHSIWRGQKAPQNPWHSNTLEWTAPVEHMHGNWPGPIPTVYRWPYDYSKPGKLEDYVPQNVPLEEGEEDH